MRTVRTVHRIGDPLMPGKHHLLAIAVLGVGATALGAAATGRILGQPSVPVGAEIRSPAGKTVGSLRIEDQGLHKSKITVTVKDLPAGYHGFHVHKKGICDARSIDPKTGSPFYSAGPHFDLGEHSHPSHSGALPPLLVARDGTGRATIVTDRFRMRRLLDGDGSAILLRAQPAKSSTQTPRMTMTRRMTSAGRFFRCGTGGKAGGWY